MLARGDLKLDDWTVLFYPIADIGMRVLLYYIGLERQLENQRLVDVVERLERQVELEDHRRLMDQGWID